MGKIENVKKRGCAVLLFVCMILQSIFVSEFNLMTVHAEDVSAAKKIISVVYDDSGSMCDANASWASANYAMQAFAALLNAQDEMYITYMSDVGTSDEGAVKIDLKKVDAAVKQIREDVGRFSGTPMKSVEIAMDKLKSIQEKDSSTQFWLVVLTDGAMASADTSYSDLQSMLNDYAGTAMSNGSKLYVHYMGIGSAAVDIKPNSSKGLDSVQAGTDIVPSLSDIANKISGRMKFEGSQMAQKDGKTIQVHSDIPLYAISVFSQGSNAAVTGASSETNLKVERNIPLKYPEIDGIQTNTSLFGNAALVTNGETIIPAGDYTLAFSEEVSLEKLVIMYQPAIKMAAKIKKNGVDVDDVDSLMIDDVIDIEIVPTNPETGEVIEESKLPKGIEWKVRYEVDGTEKAKSDNRILSGVKVEEGKNSIICTMQIPDYVPNYETISFTPTAAVVYGIQVNQPDEVDYNRSKLGIKGCRNEPVTFQITGDGVPLTKNDLKKLSLEIRESELDNSGVKGFLNRFGLMKATPNLKLNDDGTFTLYPKSSLFPAFFTKAGIYTVTVALNNDESIQAAGTYAVHAQLSDWFDLIPLLIFLLILIYLIYIFFFKAKFDGQTINIEVYKSIGSMGEGKKLATQCERAVLKKYGKDLFVPKGACTQTVGGIKVIADGLGGTYIKKRTVLGYEAWGSSNANPENNFDGVCGNLKKVKGKEEDIPDIISLGGQAFYLKQRNRLYRITIN